MTNRAGTFYSLFEYGWMAGKKSAPRVQAYVEAMQKVITPESIVLEIGTGAGLFSLIACQLGARHVYAIEPNKAILVAQELARANGFENKITFFQEMSTTVKLPEKANVIISDLRGTLPWLGHHIPTIVDARQRLLAPNGILIPQKDIVWATLINSPDLYARHTYSWINTEYHLNMSAIRKRMINTPHKGQIKPKDVVVPPVPWTTLDYMTINNSEALGKMSWEIEQANTIHGLGIWFSTKLFKEIGFSNSPKETEISAYGQMFFPLEQPVQLLAGDKVQITLQIKQLNGKHRWRWETRVFAKNSAKTKIYFSQADFYGEIHDIGQLHKKNTRISTNCA